MGVAPRSLACALRVCKLFFIFKPSYGVTRTKNNEFKRNVGVGCSQKSGARVARM